MKLKGETADGKALRLEAALAHVVMQLEREEQLAAELRDELRRLAADLPRTKEQWARIEALPLYFDAQRISDRASFLRYALARADTLRGVLLVLRGEG